MRYICGDCRYEFIYYRPLHSHSSVIGRMGLGCPVCRRSEAMTTICPRCGSSKLDIVIPEEGGEGKRD